jgi:hypothetical protein
VELALALGVGGNVGLRLKVLVGSGESIGEVEGWVVGWSV